MFKAKRARRYFVLVSQGADPVACAKLSRKRAKPARRQKRAGKDRGQGRRKAPRR